MFSPEILIVLAVVAVLFGGSRIPQLARSLGTAKAEFEDGMKGKAPSPATVPVADTDRPNR